MPGIELVDASEAGGLPLDEVLNGRVVVVRKALDYLGVLEPLRRATFGAIAEIAPGRAAAEVEERGLEHLHEVLDVVGVAAVRTCLETRLLPAAHDMTKALLALLSPQPTPLYLGKHFGVRVMVPHEAIDADRASYGGLQGFMIPRGPHVDSWFNTGVNSVNLWIAIGWVRRGNGILIFPEAYRRDLRRSGESVHPDERLGAALNVEMEPGDVLVFAADHLHSTEPNVTNETRYVLTRRLSVGAPKYSRLGNGWVPYYDTRLLGTPLESVASLRSRCTSSCFRQWLRVSGRSVLDSVAR